MIREIHIKPALNGYVVNVGCQNLVFASRQRLITELGRYFDHPDKLEKEYVENAINKTDYPVAPAGQCCEAQCEQPNQVRALR